MKNNSKIPKPNVLLKTARKRLGKTQEEIADMVGWTTQARYSTYERGTRKITVDHAEVLSKALGISAADILTNHHLRIDELELQTRKASSVDSESDLIDTIFPINNYPTMEWDDLHKWSGIMESEQGKYEGKLSNSKHSFSLVVKTENMSPAIQIGEKILVDPCVLPESGDYVVIVSDSKSYLRQYIVDGEQRFLKSTNPDWPVKVQEFDSSMRVIGVVVEKWVRYKK